MGSVGDAYDNAMAEAFFATLETELLMQHAFATRNAARLALFDYIEAFYNSHRRHSALGYLSPAEFERRERQQHELVRGHAWKRNGQRSRRLECVRIDCATPRRHPDTP